jgi:hypothetical protein
MNWVEFVTRTLEFSCEVKARGFRYTQLPRVLQCYDAGLEPYPAVVSIQNFL